MAETPSTEESTVEQARTPILGKGSLWSNEKGASGLIKVGNSEYRIFVGESQFKGVGKSGHQRPDKYVLVFEKD